MTARRILLPALFLALGYGFWISPDFKAIAAGVAIFLFGMIALEEGFRAFTGGTLERILQRSTDRLWKSVSFGVMATTLMQSSSLVSVITITFLSAGMIGLAQGIGIIFGANLGTTTGAWLVAGFGLKVDIAGYAMPMLVFGVILLFQKSKVVKGIGYVLTGLGFLFLGIHYMKEGFETFKETINLAEYAIPGIKGLLIYTLLGIFATVVMQSSHATLVLTITALAANQITYENALALSIGANVGTTITAMLGAISANIEGRRLAGAHLIFNVVTGAVALLFIGQFVFTVETLGHWLGIAEDDHTLKLALFHTLFNLVGVALMLPLIGRLVTFLERVMQPRPRTVAAPKYLNAGMLEMPVAAVEAVRKELKHLYSNTFDVISLVLHVDPAQLRKGQKLELLSQPAERLRPIDIDDYYQRRVKPLYGSIVDFIARLQVDERQGEYLYKLRAAGHDIIEALKDIKHLQKNLVRFQGARNPYLQGEYVAMRKRLALLLYELYRLLHEEEAEGETLSSLALLLDTLRVELQEQEQSAGKRLNQLIRDRRIDAETATSLMNDSSYAFSAAYNLLDMASIVITPFEPLLHEIHSGIKLEEHEINAVIEQGGGGQ